MVLDQMPCHTVIQILYAYSNIHFLCHGGNRINKPLGLLPFRLLRPQIVGKLKSMNHNIRTAEKMTDLHTFGRHFLLQIFIQPAAAPWHIDRIWHMHLADGYSRLFGSQLMRRKNCSSAESGRLKKSFNSAS